MDSVAECVRKDRDFVITQESTSPLRACDARLSCSAPADPESHPPLEATIRRLYFNTIALGAYNVHFQCVWRGALVEASFPFLCALRSPFPPHY